MSRSPPHPAVELYRDLLEQIDAWFRTAGAERPGVVPCGRGCSACCHGPFDISVADLLLVREGFRRLPPPDQAAFRAAAERLRSRFKASEPSWGPPWDLASLGEERFDALAESLAETPCPALDPSGACRIYRHRPLVCRLMGLGLVSPAGRLLENSCPIQAEFPSYAALAPIPFDLERWEEEELACLEAAAVVLLGSVEQAGFETTLAGALPEEG